MGFNLAGLSLTSSGGRGGRDGSVSYTTAERDLCKQILCYTLPSVDVKIPKPVEIDPVIDLAWSNIKQKYMHTPGLPNICRALYRGIVEMIIGEDGHNANADYPRLRDPSSIQNLFRGAAKDLGIEQEVIDTAFPSYTKKKTA